MRLAVEVAPSAVELPPVAEAPLPNAESFVVSAVPATVLRPTDVEAIPSAFAPLPTAVEVRPLLIAETPNAVELPPDAEARVPNAEAFALEAPAA